MTQHDSDSSAQRSEDAETEIVPLAEETLHVDKRDVATGRVRISTKTEIVEELARAALESETVEVTRVPIDRIVDQAPGIRTEGDVTIIPILEEVLVVEKRLVLKEELHVRKTIATDNFEIPVQLRKQRATVERLSGDEDDAVEQR
ncbi:YsnF/AvaK domain-containing protein [Microvirga pakistanensis]|uniref:YsnF/AvaK domain-containing protein n=1 Tax=Microvirga pakistanensis TaxID=1682650 RepID=UPI00106ABA9B|nr:YsnF/AvaK domain-containing protein [Microvirga pakistanensis]